MPCQTTICRHCFGVLGLCFGACVFIWDLRIFRYNPLPDFPVTCTFSPVRLTIIVSTTPESIAQECLMLTHYPAYYTMYCITPCWSCSSRYQIMIGEILYGPVVSWGTGRNQPLSRDRTFNFKPVLGTV